MAGYIPYLVCTLLQPFEPIHPQHDCRSCFHRVEVHEHMSHTNPGRDSVKLCLLSAQPGSDAMGGASSYHPYQAGKSDSSVPQSCVPFIVFQNLSIIRCHLLLATACFLEIAQLHGRQVLFQG